MCERVDVCEIAGMDEYMNGRDSEELLSRLNRSEAVVKSIYASEEKIFYEVEKGGIRSLTKTAIKLLVCLNDGIFNEQEVDKYIQKNIYLNIFRLAINKYITSIENDTVRTIDNEVKRLNNIVTDIRVMLTKRQIDKFEKKVLKAKYSRSGSMRLYIRSFIRQHSKLEVLRVDMLYRKGKFTFSDDFESDRQAVLKDWRAMRDDLRSGKPIPGLIGYSARLEYGALSGFHFHTLLFFKGSEHREDIVMAKLIGEHWSRVITKNEGRYYNCNRHKNEYKYPAIGMIHYREKEKIKALESVVVNYLAKPDYVLESLEKPKRVLFQGVQSPITIKRGPQRKYE
ncbi:inovirus Gp2 family protein (plasmid) [Halomonas sediminis]